MAAFAERQAMKAIDYFGGEKAVRAAKRIRKLASHQGGKNMRENYVLLGKRSLEVAAMAAVGLTVGVVVGGVALTRHCALRSSKESQRIGRQKKGNIVSVNSGEKNGKQDAEEQALAIKPTFYRRYGKRICDIAISIAAMPVVVGTIVGCGIAIRHEDGGPIFYNAPRVGKDGKEFMMYKLRTMKVNSPDLVMEDGSTYNGADDPRMTKVGAFLRKTSLDEIPQFLNVLKGEMSVVGPRPDLKREVDLYQGDEALKLTVKPGVTGYAAVYGRNSLPWHERLALDIYYVLHLSFPLDSKVFFKTFITVFKQDGIYVEDDVKSTIEDIKALPIAE